MRKILCTSILVLALCGSAFAGDAGCPPAPAAGDIPSPPFAAGDIECPPGATESADAQIEDGLMEAALNVLNSVLVLL